MNAKKYKEEFSNYMSIMNEALKRDNFDAYDTAREMLKESIDEYRHEKELESQLDTNNFGVLNHIFEDRLPELFKSNKKVVRDVIKLIKEDKVFASDVGKDLREVLHMAAESREVVA